jgi:hypothetical protein
MSYVVYDEKGWNWHSVKEANPDWDRVVEAIRRLDRFRYPYVWLFIGDNDDDVQEDCLNVVGGDGAYWVGLSSGRFDQLRLFDPCKGSQEISLWTSDQGFSDYEFHVTYDIELILRIVYHFAQTGEPLPEATWESDF